MSASLSAITALIVALTGLVGAVTTMLAILLRRTKKTQNLVNGHLTSLIDILQQADVTLPSGAKIKYVPPNQKIDIPGEIDELEEYLASLKGELNGD